MYPRSAHLLATLYLAAAALPVQALQHGTTPTGVRWVSGGIGHAERQELQTQRQHYSFWLATAAKRSGAFLANVEVRIVDTDKGQLVLLHTMDGPWMFAALAPGRYEIQAVYEANGQAQTQRGTTQIHPGDHHEMMLYFSDDTEVGEQTSAKN